MTHDYTWGGGIISHRKNAYSRRPEFMAQKASAPIKLHVSQMDARSEYVFRISSLALPRTLD